jgi:hypothetical protein
LKAVDLFNPNQFPTGVQLLKLSSVVDIGLINIINVILIIIIDIVGIIIDIDDVFILVDHILVILIDSILVMFVNIVLIDIVDGSQMCWAHPVLLCIYIRQLGPAAIMAD